MKYFLAKIMKFYITMCSITGWSDNFRYLGVYLRSSRSFVCSFSHAKHSMYRAFNAVFAGKLGELHVRML